MIRNSRWRSFSCAFSVGNRSGCADGSSTICAKITARAAASGRRAHHRCSVHGCPWRIDFSRAEASLMASSGRATSISFFVSCVHRRRLSCSRQQLGEVVVHAGHAEVRLALERLAQVVDAVRVVRRGTRRSPG